MTLDPGHYQQGQRPHQYGGSPRRPQWQPLGGPCCRRYVRIGVLAQGRQSGYYALPLRSAFVFGGCIDSGRADAERR